MILSKKEVRSEMLALRNGLSKQYIKDHRKQLIEKLLPFCLKVNPSVIHSFIPFKKEPDLFPILEQFLANNIKVIAPKTLQKGDMGHYEYTGTSCLQKGLFQTLYPKNTKEYKESYSIILVPGLAFDYKGLRLGYGGGYYDRFLFHHPEAVKIGIVYPFQLLEQVPTESHDQAVDYVFANELIEINGS